MKAVGYIATTIAVMAYAVMMNGWVLAKLWAWFIVPTFEAPVLSIPEAIGLALVVSYLTVGSTGEKPENYKAWVTDLILRATVKPLSALGFGAIIRLWL